jgi:hypothetical protein
MCGHGPTRSVAPCLYSRRVNAEFNWWLLIVGLVIGAGVVWLILADTARREVDIARRERAAEARWIAAELRRGGQAIADDDVADVLDLHAAYLEAPPPDDLPEPILDATSAPFVAPSVSVASGLTADSGRPADGGPATEPESAAERPQPAAERPQPASEDQPTPSRTG